MWVPICALANIRGRSVFFFLIPALLIYNSRTIKFTLLKCRIQWCLVQRCTFTTNSRTSPSPPKETLYPLAVNAHPPVPPAPENHKPTFCFHTSAHSGYFIQMESHNTRPSVSGFFTQHDVFRVHPCRGMWGATSIFPFLFKADSPSTVWTDHIQFIPLSTDGYLDCFYFSALMNSAVMNIRV